MSRVCAVCEEQGRRRELKDHLHHLHELEPGDEALVPYVERLVKVIAVGPGRVRVAEDTDPEHVSFRAAGKDVSFERTASSETVMSPTTEVMI